MEQNESRAGKIADPGPLNPDFDFIKSSNALHRLRQRVLSAILESFDTQCLYVLPPLQLQELKSIATYNFTVVSSDPQGLSDYIKSSVERWTGKPWIWTPFQAPRPTLTPGKMRFIWKCVSRIDNGNISDH